VVELRLQRAVAVELLAVAGDGDHQRFYSEKARVLRAYGKKTAGHPANP
jgi:hypothetical protein